MKYIMFEDLDGRALPIIFPATLVHKDVAEKIQELLEKNFKDDNKYKIVSAGELNLVDSDILCTGKSETLNIESRDNIDSRIIKWYNYHHGF